MSVSLKKVVQATEFQKQGFFRHHTQSPGLNSPDEPPTASPTITPPNSKPPDRALFSLEQMLSHVAGKHLGPGAPTKGGTRALLFQKSSPSNSASWSVSLAAAEAASLGGEHRQNVSGCEGRSARLRRIVPIASRGDAKSRCRLRPNIPRSFREH
jgi:hypothetical protein